MNIVITGSTKGIGYGMAREFLKRGHNIMISSRRTEAVAIAVTDLGNEFPDCSVLGQPCDVAEFDQVEALWDAAERGFGQVDIWINNAGRDGMKVPFFALPQEDYMHTVQTNIVGLLHCNRVVIPKLYQQGGGMIWNMEGFGSNGMTRRGVSVYGSTKCALRYFTKSVVAELEGTPVKMCYLSPGIVVTDMLVPPPDQRGEGWEQVKKVLNILADTVETVTPFLVEGILAADRNGAAVRWLTRPKTMWRFISSRFIKRDVFTPLGL
ncbi:MAG TPA: SDR family oxidoreductase [Gammaproteobacteria bacterium]|jgi:short-subunit dehydrogenase|nr:chitin-binding protein [Chromatiales bacterium]MCP4925561.1 SDR family oxidoreductase [Gammaproteobacteria bacterium]MDP7153355.1 SDR family oxidoreductase [Gammaproteobacteria bacterium]MDP7659724.1 SDR family oxidoreductase [Gammaproteobacteria bacterium]HJP39586.1 SDR family oxidoreductase [Gammaproteobacteria bacterium]